MIRFIVVVILLAAACGERAATPSPALGSREPPKAMAAEADEPLVVCPAGTTQRRHASFGIRDVWCENHEARHHGPMLRWWSSGQLMEEMTYVHGRLEGLFRGWYETGAREVERNYRAGRLHGKALGWHPNGKKALESDWSDGELVGVARRWDENGRPERVTK